MRLVNGFTLMKYAKENNLVLPAFNTTNYELTLAIVQAFEHTGLGGYIQISSNNLKLSNPEIIANMVSLIVKKENISVPISLHLDHGKSFEDVKNCIDAGFTSIMFDASNLPLDENIAAVRRVVEYAHYFGIPVEAEIGGIKGKEDEEVSTVDDKTKPEDVQYFVEQTKCDTVAVSIGNVHGLDLAPELDFELLEEIERVTPVPLVLHGGSGIPFEQVRKAKSHNIIKINYGSQLRKSYIETFGKAYEKNHNEFDFFSLGCQAVNNVTGTAKAIIQEINIRN